MSFEEYIVKGGQRLRLGYTTGSCAAAAAGAAAAMLVSGRQVTQMRLRTPKGIDLVLEIEDVHFFGREGEIPLPPPENAGPGLRPEDSGAGGGRAGAASCPEKDGRAFLPKEETKEMQESPEIQAVSCAVRKDSGDDPDVTNGALIYARAARSRIPGIRIDGGEGVGRVTRSGLDQPVGHAAINSTPRRMIEEAVRRAFTEESALSGREGRKNRIGNGNENHIGSGIENRIGNGVENRIGNGNENRNADRIKNRIEREAVGFGDAGAGGAADPVPGFDVTIYVPRGRELAEKTFNPKLGIVGGISILGTSGIVEPMSEQALLDTIRAEIRVRAAEKWPILPAAPGNYGKNFFLETYGFSLDTAVTSSNFIYETVKMAEEAGFRRMLFVGHIGKLVKVAGGVRNTHSQYGDRRMEILQGITGEILAGGSTGVDADEILKAGPGANRSFDDGKSADRRAGDRKSLVREALLACVTTDEAVRVLQAYGLAGPVLSEMTRRIQTVMQAWTAGRMQVEVIVFSNVFGELGRTGETASFLERLRQMTPVELRGTSAQSSAASPACGPEGPGPDRSRGRNLPVHSLSLPDPGHCRSITGQYSS